MSIQSLVKKQETAVASDSLMDLSLIRVPEDQQGRMPGVAGFPKKFSPDSMKVWIEMVQDPEFKQRCKVWGSLDLAWHNAILEFLKRCDSAGVFPFSDNSSSARNEYVQEFVRRCRIALVAYADEAGIFEKVRVRKVWREYVRKENGLIIRSWAELYPVQDPSFEKWLTTMPMPRFIKTTGNRFIRVVQPNVSMWVKYLSPGRVTVGFDIEVAGSIAVNGKNTPTRKQVNKFLDNAIFLPIVRAHRFQAVKNRLF